MGADQCSVIILSHGRPTCTTASTLRRQGYRGQICLLLDDTDTTADEYAREHPDCDIFTFSKADWMADADTFLDTPRPGCVLFARNASAALAAHLGRPYFLQLDDDYSSFLFRFPISGVFKSRVISDFSAIIEAYCDFLAETDIPFCAFPQGGDFIGGGRSPLNRRPFLAKAMNSFFCRTSAPPEFIGNINEDVNLYTTQALRGRPAIQPLLYTQLIQQTTQSSSGGMTSQYISEGTFFKSAFSLVAAPSAVRISLISGCGGSSKPNRFGYPSHPRLHHNVIWNRDLPLFVTEEPRP